MTTESAGLTLIKGAVAGAAATWLMNQVTTRIYERESDEVKTRENHARGDQTAYASAAHELARISGVELSREQEARAGTAIHWATGVMAGIKYAIFRRYWPAITAGRGVPYGLAFYLVMDEGLNPLLGLTPGPAAFPWQTHARGAAGHVAFGAVNDGVLRALDAVC